jgi:hypothetical protein
MARSDRPLAAMTKIGQKGPEFLIYLLDLLQERCIDGDRGRRNDNSHNDLPDPTQQLLATSGGLHFVRATTGRKVTRVVAPIAVCTWTRISAGSAETGASSYLGSNCGSIVTGRARSNALLRPCKPQRGVCYRAERLRQTIFFAAKYLIASDAMSIDSPRDV